MVLEELITQAGSLGPFQGIVVALIFLPKCFIIWSLLIITFSEIVPDWWCIPGNVSSTEIGFNFTVLDNVTFKVCELQDGGACLRTFDGTLKTIVNQWNLICEREWIVSTVTSVQTGGILTGALLGAQVSDVIGRKATLFSVYFMHGMCCICAAFSGDWRLFAVYRFFIGTFIGTFLVISVTLPMEFLGSKWRPLMTALPAWSIGTGMYALSSWIFKDWANIHLACAVCSFPFIVGWLFVPESLRWLTVKGRVEHAEKIVEKMCKLNARNKPADCFKKLKTVAYSEYLRHTKVHQYTILDVYRGRQMVKTTLLINFVWLCCPVIYYGVTFTMLKISQNMFLDTFLLTVIEIPVAFSTFVVSNIIGRRLNSALYFFVTAAACLAILLVSLVVSTESKPNIVTGLTVVAKLAAAGGWMAFQTLTAETYPTVVRNLGFGMSHAMSSVGALLAPVIISMGGPYSTVSYAIMAVMMTFSTVFSLLLQETNKVPLPDTMTDLRGTGTAENRIDVIRESTVEMTRL